MTARLAAAIDATERILEARAAKASARPWDALLAGLFVGLRDLLSRAADSLAANIRRLGPGGADDPVWWEHHRADVLDELSSGLTPIARLGAQAARDTLGTVTVQVNWGLANQNAVAAAQAQAAQLITGIDATTRQAVREAVSEWVASGEPLDTLANKIQSLTAFSPDRARLIAQTESTNAFALGNAQAWEAAGVAPPAFMPSAHPGCRCYLQPYRMAGGQMVMVWYTAVDERVCTQEIITPWGPVAGCRALHNTIVSRGPWLGSKRE